SARAREPGVVYSYDIAIAVGATTHTLASLGLLKSAPSANGGPDELARPHLALGYVDDFLPSFALPPTTLDDLRIVYGSCRRPANEHPDAMAMIDDFIDDAELYDDALKRPHQMLLGGDQIYADDVWPGHLIMINRLGNELIGTYEANSSLPGPQPRVPVETVSIDYKPIPDDPLSRRWQAGGPTALPIDLIAFPPGRRQGLVLRQAQMTTVDGESHLLSFGEFAAMYLMVWCNACWPLPPQWPQFLDLHPQKLPPTVLVPPDVPAVKYDWEKLEPKDVGLTAQE